MIQLTEHIFKQIQDFNISKCNHVFLTLRKAIMNVKDTKSTATDSPTCLFSTNQGILFYQNHEVLCPTKLLLTGDDNVEAIDITIPRCF